MTREQIIERVEANRKKANLFADIDLLAVDYLQSFWEVFSAPDEGSCANATARARSH